MKRHPSWLALAAVSCSFACNASPPNDAAKTAEPATSAPTVAAASPAPPAAFAQIAVAEDARKAERVRLYADDPDPRVRARAARAFGRIGDPADGAALATLAKDADRAVAAEALFALGIAGVGDEAPAIAALCASSDAAIRAAAVEALGRSNSDANAGVCASLLMDRDARVRGEAAIAVGRLAGERFAGKKTLDENGVGALVGALANAIASERDVEARWREVYALASLRSDKAKRALMAAAIDGQPLVRLFAVRGLARLADDDELRGRLAKCAADPDDRVAAEAAAAIARHPSPATGEAIARLLDHPAVFVRRAAARSMGGFATSRETVDHVLAKAKADRSASVAAEAAASRARAGFPDAAEWIAEAFDDPRPLVREKAAAEAASLSDAEKAEILVLRGLQDRDANVAAAAATAVGKLKNSEKARELAYRALKHPRGLVRENAAGALDELSKRDGPIPKRDLETLLYAMVPPKVEADDVAESRASILEAVANIGARMASKFPSDATSTGQNEPYNPTFDPWLRYTLDKVCLDSDPTVRAKAKQAVKTLWPSTTFDDTVASNSPVPSIPGANAPAFTHNPRVRVKTSRGAFEATLFADDAPVHAENFLRLAEAKHYDGTPFHRVEINFVVQGGDHLGDGTGSRAAWGGCLRDEINRRPFARGTLGMPKSDVPDSGGCQIFVMHVPAPHLDGRYTAFGQVERGLEVIDALEVGDRIESVEVLDSGR